MFKLVLRGFVQRKLRVLLTAVAIALGVALMAGTYVLTDTINHSFAAIFQTASKGHDVVVTPTQTLGRRVRSQTSPITEELLAKVRATPGVAEASGAIFSPGTFLDTHGKRLTTGGAPGFVASTVPARFESFKPVRGGFPSNAQEVAIDEATAERESLKIGQQIVVAGAAVARRYTIVGIVQFGGGQSFGERGPPCSYPPRPSASRGSQDATTRSTWPPTPGSHPASCGPESVPCCRPPSMSALGPSRRRRTPPTWKAT